MSQPSERTGNIYDLGYRSYNGPRLGRPYAVLSLYLESLRASFGLGRRASNKIIPVLLTILAYIPAVVQLGIAAVANNIVEVFRPEEYYGYIQVILALFTAAVAPELVGRDQRTRVLSLYFSRSLRRSDYMLAKLAAMSSALLLLTVFPQLVLFIGNGFAGNDTWEFMTDNWDQVPRILGSGILISALFASIGLAVASQTSRRGYSTAAIFVLLVALWTVMAIIVRSADAEAANYALLLSPLHVVRGLTLWIFDATPGTDTDLGVADLPLELYVLSCLAFIALAGYLLWRRYERIPA